MNDWYGIDEIFVAKNYCWIELLIFPSKSVLQEYYYTAYMQPNLLLKLCQSVGAHVSVNVNRFRRFSSVLYGLHAVIHTISTIEIFIAHPNRFIADWILNQ
jgi:hypothetical protein